MTPRRHSLGARHNRSLASHWMRLRRGLRARGRPQRSSASRKRRACVQTQRRPRSTSPRATAAHRSVSMSRRLTSPQCWHTVSAHAPRVCVGAFGPFDCGRRTVSGEPLLSAPAEADSDDDCGGVGGSDVEHTHERIAAQRKRVLVQLGLEVRDARVLRDAWLRGALMGEGRALLRAHKGTIR